MRYLKSICKKLRPSKVKILINVSDVLYRFEAAARLKFASFEVLLTYLNIYDYADTGK